MLIVIVETRMKTVTSRIVFFLDINTVGVLSLINIVIAMNSLKNIRRINFLLIKVLNAWRLFCLNCHCLTTVINYSIQIDADFSLFDSKDVLHTKNAKRKISWSIVIAFIILATMLGNLIKYDLYSNVSHLYSILFVIFSCWFGHVAKCVTKTWIYRKLEK